MKEKCYLDIKFGSNNFLKYCCNNPFYILSVLLNKVRSNGGVATTYHLSTSTIYPTPKKSTMHSVFESK